MKKIDQDVLDTAVDRASKIFGCDPVYYGEEGKKELDRQVEIALKEKETLK